MIDRGENWFQDFMLDTMDAWKARKEKSIFDFSGESQSPRRLQMRKAEKYAALEEPGLAAMEKGLKITEGIAVASGVVQAGGIALTVFVADRTPGATTVFSIAEAASLYAIYKIDKHRRKVKSDKETKKKKEPPKDSA